MLEQRKNLIFERKRASIQTKRQKESIAKVMDEVRTNASKANKVISQAMTGKITLESLTSPGKKPRSKTAGAGKKRKGSKGSGGGKPVQADQIGLGRDTKSAGYDAAFENEIENNPEMQKTYSAPEVPDANKPQQYKSPYAGGEEA